MLPVKSPCPWILTSVDGRAVTAECAEPRRGLNTVSKLLHPPRSAFGDTSYSAVIKHSDF